MADTVAEVLFRLNTDTSNLRKELRDVNRAGEKTSGVFNKLTGSLQGLASKVGLGGLVSNLGLVGTAVSSVNAKVVTATKSTKLLGNALKLALGPMWLLVAGVTTLALAFFKSQEGQDSLRAGFNLLNQTIQVSIGRLQEYSNKLKESFQEGGFKDLFKDFISDTASFSTNSFKLFFSNFQFQVGIFNQKVLDFRKKLGLITDKNYKKLSKKTQIFINRAIRNFNDSRTVLRRIAEEAERLAKIITDAQKAIELAQIAEQNLIRDTAVEYSIMQKTLRDVNEPIESRIKAGERALSIDRQQKLAKIEVLEKQLKLAEEEAKANSTLRSEKLEIAKIEAQIARIRGQMEAGEFRTVTQINNLKKQQIDRQLKTEREILELKNDQVALLEFDGKVRIKSLENILKQIDKESDEYENILQLIKLITKETEKQIKLIGVQKQKALISEEELQFEILVARQKQEILLFKGTEQQKSQILKEQIKAQIDELNNQINLLENLDIIDSSDILQIENLKLKVAQLTAELNKTAEAGKNLGGGLKENLLAIAESVLQISDSIFRGFEQRTQEALNRLNEQISRTQQSQQEARDLAERGNAEALNIERIRAEELDRLREQQIIRQERQVRRQIAIQQALASARILAEIFSSGGFVTVPAKLALATALIGTLSSLIPAFEKGTDNAPKGLAIVDEKGAEVILNKDGSLKEIGTGDGARLTQMKGGEKVLTAKQSIPIIESLKVDRESYQRNDKALLKAIKGIGANVILDKNGFSMALSNHLKIKSRLWQ